MANDIATLATKLTQQLRDAGHETWNSEEKEDLIRWAVASLWPSLGRYLDPTLTAQEITLVTGTFFYNLPTGMLSVHSVDRINADETEEYGPILGQAWQVVGEPLAGSGKLRVAPIIVEQGGKLRVHGYARFDTTTNLIYDEMVPLVLAMARAEAYRRIGADRVRFRQWQVANPEQNVTVNELLLLINESDAEIARLRGQLHHWKRPVPGRLG